MFCWSSGRRRSRNRWRSRSSSAARFSLRARATGMAGGVAGPATVSAVARSSTSPVDSSEFFIASGRATTSPSTRTTVSASERRRRGAHVGRTVLRVERHLHDPRAVAKVDERQSAEVAIAVHPAAKAHTLAYVGGAERSTQVRAQGRCEMVVGHRRVSRRGSRRIDVAPRGRARRRLGYRHDAASTRVGGVAAQASSSGSCRARSRFCFVEWFIPVHGMYPARPRDGSDFA